MKLNPDCVRDILLTVEQSVDYATRLRVYINDDLSEYPIKKYEHKEIIYHARQCNFSGLLVGFSPVDAGDGFYVSDLSPLGHEFLANIRSDTIWSKTKNIASSIGIFSLHGLKDIAVQVVAEVIKSSLGSP